MLRWRFAWIPVLVGLIVTISAYNDPHRNVHAQGPGGIALWKLADLREPPGADMQETLVNSTAELQLALRSANAGDKILLAPGTYTGLSFNGMNLKFSELVTVTSADPARPAVINDFALSNATNLRFANLELATLDHSAKVATGAVIWGFSVSRSDSIHFDNVKVHGSLDGDAGNDVRGLSIRDSTNISVRNSEFQQLDRAVAFAQTSNIIVQSNLLHDLRSDGLNFAEVKNVLVGENVFSTFNPVGQDHPDAMQFFTSGTKTPSSDIRITGNVILKGSGEYTQGIFMRDELGTLPFQKVVISDNLIVGTGFNGIRIMGVDGLTLQRNELVSFKGDNNTFLLVQKGNGVVATDNQAASISFDTSTNVVQTGSKITKAVDDQGLAALRRWVELHPEPADRLIRIGGLGEGPSNPPGQNPLDHHVDLAGLDSLLRLNQQDGAFLFA